MKRRAGLGRGLDALLPEAPAPAEQSRFVTVPIDAVDANPRQPRQGFAEEALAELASSVRELGILQPLLVRRSSGDRFELVAGERRLRAARLAGLEEVPALLVDTDDQGSLERAIVENLHRENLNPMEEAAAYRQLMDEGGLTQEELAERLGRNRVTVANTLRLLDLPLSIQRLISDGRLSAGHGKALLGLQGSPFQERIAQRVAGSGASVREAEELVRKHQDLFGTTSRPGAGGTRPARVTEAQRRLAERLQTRVRIEMGKRKGKIVLDFVSLDELDRVVRSILGEDQEPSA